MNLIGPMRLILLLALLAVVNSTSVFAAVDDSNPQLQQALALQKRGTDLLNQKKYKQALEAFKKSTPILERLAGKKHVATATAYYLQASCYSMIDEWSEALIYYRKAADIYEINGHQESINIYNLLSIYYYKNGLFNESIPFLEKVLVSNKKRIREDRQGYFETLKRLADSHFNESHFDLVIYLIEDALKKQDETKISKTETEVYLKNILAKAYTQTGKYHKALEVLMYCLNINKNHLKIPEQTAVSLNNIAFIYYALGDYKKALQFYLDALKITEQIFGKINYVTTITQENIANIYVATGEFKKALEIYEKSLAIRQKKLGLNDPLVAESLKGLASVHQELANYQRALDYLSQAHEINIKKFGENNKEISNILLDKAAIYSEMGDFDRAITFNNSAIENLKNTFGEHHPNVYTATNNIALLYSKSGYSEKALKILNSTIENINKFWGKDHIRSIPTYNNLATIYYEIGKYNEAIDILSNSLSIEKANYGDNHFKTAITLNNLGNCYLAIGDYSKSLNAFEESLKVKKLHYDDNHNEISQSYGNLASFYWEIGDLDKALHYGAMAYEILKQRLEENPINYAITLNQLAAIHSAKGQKQKAIELYRQSLAIVEKKLGSFHPETALRYHNLGCAFESSGDMESASSFAKKALEIRKTTLGNNHHLTAQSYNALGYIKFLNKEFDESMQLYNEALNIQSNIYGDDNAETLVTLDNIASLHATFGNEEATLKYFDRVLKARKRLLQRLMLLGEKSRIASLNKFRSFNYAISLPPHRTADLLLSQKGIVLDSVLEDRAVALESQNSGEGAKNLQRINELRSKLSKIIFEEGKARQVSDLENEIGLLQRNLAGDYFNPNTQRPSLNLTMADVAPTLSSECILLDFFRFEAPKVLSDEIQSMGVIITSGDNKSILVQFNKYSAIQGAIKDLRKSLDRGDPQGVQQSTAFLSENLWLPIAAKIPAGKNQLIISPDGELNFLSFAALVDGQGQFLAETYDISYMGSARDLVRKTKSQPSRTLRLFANPAFHRDTTQVEDMKFVMRSAELDIFGQLQLPPLPGTEKESAEIQKIASEAGWNLQTYTREQADEPTLRQTKKPGILHLATHGFYLNSFTPAPMDSRGMSVIGLDKTKPDNKGVDPMRASGIALAGAQSTLKSWSERKAPDPESDGVLTAEEVAALDLDGTWLVTLSACETGVGEARSGEGVFGLRRAFMMAGAENLLMTLWPVSDQTTSEIMADFYREALKTGNAPGSLAKVQREWLVKLRKEKGLLEAVRDAGPFVMATIGKPLPPLPREPAKQESLLDKVGRKIEALIQSNNTDIKNN